MLEQDTSSPMFTWYWRPVTVEVKVWLSLNIKQVLQLRTLHLAILYLHNEHEELLNCWSTDTLENFLLFENCDLLVDSSSHNCEKMNPLNIKQVLQLRTLHLAILYVHNEHEELLKVWSTDTLENFLLT